MSRRREDEDVDFGALVTCAAIVLFLIIVVVHFVEAATRSDDPLADYSCGAWYYDDRGPVDGRYCAMWVHNDHELREGRLVGGRLNP